MNRVVTSRRMMIKKFGTTKDLFGIIVFLVSDASSYVTGQDFYIDGGFLSKGMPLVLFLTCLLKSQIISSLLAFMDLAIISLEFSNALFASRPNTC